MRSSVCEVLAGAVDALAALALDGVAMDGLCVAELQHLTGQVSDLSGRLAGVEVVLVGALDARSGGKVPPAPVRTPGVAPEPTAPGSDDGADGPDVADGMADGAGADACAAGDPAPAPGVVAGRCVLVQHWLRDRTGCGGASAAALVRLAASLRQVPLILAAVTDGRLSVAHARVLCRLVGQIDPDGLLQAQSHLLAVAAQRDPVELAVYVRHLLATWCEPQFEADQRSQDNRRYLQSWRTAQGMLAGRFRITATDSEVLLTLLEPLARPTGLGDTRSAGQRRADALIEVCQQVLGFGDLPDAGGLRPQVSYIVPAGWAAGQDRTGSHPFGSFADLVGASLPSPGLGGPGLGGPGLGGTVCGDRPGALPPTHACAVGAWSGPQTRSHIEMILCDARLTRVLLDTRGQVKGLEALGDTITTTQRRAIAARDGGCCVRGCTRPPAFCDAHHLDHRADGGVTDVDNLVLLCRRHHTQWHQGRLTLRQLHVPWITGTHDPPF